MADNDFVPEDAIDYDEVFRRGGRNDGDEDFALMRCPRCGHVYLFEYEVDTVYLDGRDLTRRAPVSGTRSFACVGCGEMVPHGRWAGPKASPDFRVTWRQLATSDWAWAVKPRTP